MLRCFQCQKRPAAVTYGRRAAYLCEHCASANDRHTEKMRRRAARRLRAEHGTGAGPRRREATA